MAKFAHKKKHDEKNTIFLQTLHLQTCYYVTLHISSFWSTYS